jgi:hypothetical protein
MRSKNYYRVRTLVRIAFWGGLVFALLAGIDHLNWVGDHYCFKSSIECYGLDK